MPDATHDAGHRVNRASRATGVLVLGLAVGLLAALVARELAPRTAPLAILPILLSTLIAGRLAPTGAALAHGACAWAALIIVSDMMHRPSPAWESGPAMILLPVLIADMALIGRVGYVRHLISRQHGER